MKPSSRHGPLGSVQFKTLWRVTQHRLEVAEAEARQCSLYPVDNACALADEIFPLKHLLVAAESGDAAAQFNIGVLYDSRLEDNGYGIEANRAEAMKMAARCC